MDLLWWNDALSIALGLFYLALAVVALHYRLQERRDSILSSFRLLTIILMSVIGIYYLALAFGDAASFPRVFRAGFITKGLWFVTGTWVLSQLWISHAVMTQTEGRRE